MKYSILSVLCLFCFTASFAAVWTVSNDPFRVAQFKDIGDAHTAASNFDTIYIYGCSSYYLGVTVSKRLVILGPGYNSTSSNTNKAMIDGMSFGAGSSNSVLYGVVTSVTGTSATANNILISRCDLSALTIYNTNANWIVENCVINSINITQGTISIPVAIRNNIMSGSFSGNTSNNLISIQNNLFVNYSTTFFFYSPIKRAMIKNNIFFGTDPGGADSCVFLNNLTWGIPITSQQSLPYGTNIGTGNIIISNPNFINAMNNSAFDYNNDFRLSSNSPAKNTGSDGTDIGPTGGVSPLYPTTGPITGMAPIPSITEMTLPVNAAIQGGNIQVFIRGKRNN